MSAALTVLTDSIVEINRRASGSKLAALSVCVVLGALAGCSGGGGGGSAPVVAAPDSFVFEGPGIPLTVTAPGVLANDSGGTLTASVVSLPSQGTLTLNPNGSFSYTPGASGSPDSFTYRASSSGGGSSDTTVSLTVNQPPVTANACVTTPENTAVNGTLIATDESGSQPFTFSQVVDPTVGPHKGVVNVTAGGSFTYTPNTPGAPSALSSFVGMDKFKFRVTDKFGLSSEAIATVLINGAVRIMPLGDSITEGVTLSSTVCDGSSCPVGPLRIGYRKKLYDDLEALSPSYDIRMVGSRLKGESAGLAAPNNAQEGHPGWCAGPNGDGSSYCSTVVPPENVPRNLADNVTGWLNANQPDIILLHAGTNSFTTSASDMDTLLDAIDAWQAANYPITVFLARILQEVTGTTPTQTAQFNNTVAAMVGARPNNRVITVNQQTGAGIIYSVGIDMGDDIHPNQTGYNKMATKWLTDITNPANVGPKFIGLPSCP